MNCFISRLIPLLLLLITGQACAETGLSVSPALGGASISNIDGYDNSTVLRVDGTFNPIPEFGIGVFGTGYSGFQSTGSGNKVTIKVNGFGAAMTASLPLHPRVQPYLRVEYMHWNAEASRLGATLSKDNGNSPGLALGARFPILKFLIVRAEVSGTNNVSGADIRQILVGAHFTF